MEPLDIDIAITPAQYEVLWEGLRAPLLKRADVSLNRNWLRIRREDLQTMRAVVEGIIALGHSKTVCHAILRRLRTAAHNSNVFLVTADNIPVSNKEGAA
jgi:hypothetical protein